MAESNKAMKLRHAKVLGKIAKEEAAEAKGYKAGGAVKPAFLFKGKESSKEEKAEKKVGKAAYAKGEAKEKFVPFGKKK